MLEINFQKISRLYLLFALYIKQQSINSFMAEFAMNTKSISRILSIAIQIAQNSFASFEGQSRRSSGEVHI